MIVAVGSVIALTPFYDWLMEWVTSVNLNPYVLAVLASGVLAAITASASGAITIVFKLLGPTFVQYGAMGLFSVCKVTHKQAYRHVFVTTILVPIIACYLIELPFCLIFG